jgi:hypothetical protein
LERQAYAEAQDALLSLTTGSFNTAVAFVSLRSNTPRPSVLSRSLTIVPPITTGRFATAALFHNTTDFDNTAIAVVLFSNTTGSGNTAFGKGTATLFSC